MNHKDQDILPKRGDYEAMSKQDRVYRTSLAASDYLKLEMEGLERGLKPYGFTRQIVTMYLNKKLLVITDLKPEYQQQLNQFLTKIGYIET